VHLAVGEIICWGVAAAAVLGEEDGLSAQRGGAQAAIGLAEWAAGDCR